MTELEALVKSVKIWTWLAETGSADKTDAYRELGLERSDRCDCPLCENAYQEYRKSNSTTICYCQFCSLYGMWVDGHTRSTCMHAGSPFDNWGSSRCDQISKDAARGVLDLLKLRISQLEKQQ